MAQFTLPTEDSVLPKIRMKFWSERVDPAAHLELRRFIVTPAGRGGLVIRI